LCESTEVSAHIPSKAVLCNIQKQIDMSMTLQSQSPRSLQADFNGLAFPSEHEECLLTETITDHPVLSRRCSSAKSDEEGLETSSKKGDLDKILDELLLLMPALRMENIQSKEGTATEHEFSVGHVASNAVTEMKPPRRFYRRCWRGIAQRMIARENENHLISDSSP
jgi:hypothetical protein